MLVRIKRIYDPPSDEDDCRVLVDRLWPRGLKKENAGLDYWAKDLAPTTELRKWFGHDCSKFSEFRKRYLKQLEANPQPVRDILEAAKGRKLTLLFAARDRHCNHAVILKQYLLEGSRL